MTVDTCNLQTIKQHCVDWTCQETETNLQGDGESSVRPLRLQRVSLDGPDTGYGGTEVHL